MSLVSEATIIKLHVGPDETVWYARGMEPPVNSQQTVSDFLLSPVAHGLSSVFRVLGSESNAELILKLYWHLHRGEIHDLQVAPLPKLSLSVRNDPVFILFNSRRIFSSPSCGGWESLSAAGFATYALIREFRLAREFSDKCRRILRLHPVYRAASFIPTLDDSILVELIKLIVDPRRFVDTRVPDKPSKIGLYFGLTPAVQRRVTEGDAPPAYQVTRASSLREQRCAVVLACWRPENIAEHDFTNPANFLLRAHRAAGGGYRGDLRASQVFLRYIAQNWTAGLSLCPGSYDKIFASDLFFKSDAEISAYAQHMAKPDPENM